MMSDKKRKRGRPRVAPLLSYGSEQKLRNNSQRTIKKPKYLKDHDDDDNISRGSTPARSIDSIGSQNGSKTKKPRGSGCNPSIDDKDSEYHYGSDFENDDDEHCTEKNSAGADSRSVSGASSEDDLSELDETLVLVDGLSDGLSERGNFVPFWQLGPAGTLGVRASTPVPVWLQDRDYPELILPKSSDDLLLPKPFVFIAVGIYEILRHFRHLVRLSPFYFENFCAALIVPEQSNLLIEIHIALTKALIREEDSQQTHFGPLDQKDSVNISLYFVDNLTWPETLRQYLFSDKSFKPVLDILNSCNYPFTSLSNRLEVLKFLCDQFLQTSVVRDFLLKDGKISYDDHCRACYKPGDLLCCDSCSAVYHLECVNPPIECSPSEIEEWTCIVCNAEKLEGVTNCLSLMESSGIICRQEPLGFDRQGRKYWFLARRIFVESDDGQVSYYSTTRHLDMIMSLIDKDDLEQSLHEVLEEFLDDIKRQMEITEKLTDEAKGDKMDELTLELEEIEIKIEELEAKKQNEININEIKQEKVELVKEDPDEIGVTIKSEEMEEKDEPNNIVKELENEVKKEEDCSSKYDEKSRKVWDEITLKAMIKNKLQQFQHNNSTSPYRLGCNNSYRSYVNQFTSNTLALNKSQHNEERDKRRQLSHKFTLTNGTDFKWSGSVHGSKENQTSTVRQTLCSLEQNISCHFFHPHWQNIRKSWLQSVNNCSAPNQFAKAMTLLVSCIKPVVFLSAWHESLGHIRLKRITVLDREERKKQEKRDKREADDEAKLFPFVKYSKIPKHQLWKMKGEEYRMHGLWGWQWLASHRRTRPQCMSKLGLRSGPNKVCLPIKNDDDSCIKTLSVSAESFKIVSSKNRHLQFSLLSPKQRREEDKLKGLEEASVQTDFVVSGSTGIHQALQVCCVNLEDYFEDDIVPISKALSNRNRILYPKIAKVSSLDRFLARRLALKLREERSLESKKNAKSEDDSNFAVNVENDSEVTDTDNSDNENVEELPDSQRLSLDMQGPTATLLKEIRTYKSKYESLDKVDAYLPCYSPACRREGRVSCYSPSCILKEKTKQKLIMSLKNYKIVSGKHAPFDVIGSCSPIRVKELDKSPEKITNVKVVAPKVNGSATNQSVISNDSIVDSSESKVFGDEEIIALNHKNKDRIFSSEDTSGIIYLKNPFGEDKKYKRSNAFTPNLCSFRIHSQGEDKIKNLRQSFFVLPTHELRILARKGGRYVCSGYSQNAKTNPYTWPYPSARPVFKQTWLYRTMTMPAISSAAYQLRILWACLRWEDMHEKGHLDGRKQVNSDIEIVQTEILKRKHLGRFLEKTDYLRRKVTIPLDVPKTVREFTPSQRSGLRKRRRAHSPMNKQPESIEEWIEEEKFDLWEIRLFGERLEKAASISKKAAADKESLTPISRTISPSDFKAKMEEQMKVQRASFLQKKSLEHKSSPNIIKVAIGSALSNAVGSSKIILGGSSIVSVGSKLPISSILANRKIVTTKGGKVITVQTSGATSAINQSTTTHRFTIGKNSTVFPLSSLPKVHVTSQGNKVIKLPSISAGLQRPILPRSGVSSTPVTNAVIRPITTIVNSSTTPTTIRPLNTTHPIQFVRLADGQIQLKTLTGAQQLIQRGDGKIQILNAKSIGTVTASQSPIQITQQQLKPITGLKGLSGGQIVKINGQQIILRTKNPDLNKSPALTEVKKIIPQGNLKAVKTSEGYAFKAIGASNPPKLLKEKQLSEVISPPKSPVIAQSTLTLRVQVRMTDQGPKTIIQGLQPGAALTKDHIMAIQQQVRSMLSKYSLQVNQLSPLMTITLNTGVIKEQEIALKVPQIPRDQNSPTKISPSKFLLSGESKTTLPTKKITPTKSKVPSSPFNSPANITSQGGKKEFIISNELIQQPIKTPLHNKNELISAAEEKFVQLKKLSSDKTKTEEFKDITSQLSKRKLEKDENEWDPTSPDARSKLKRPKIDRSKTKKDIGCNLSATKALAQENRRKLLRQQKLDSMLSKLKDLLKKDILKKRALLEKELQIQIHKDLAVAKQHMLIMDKIKTSENVLISKKKHDTSTSSQGGTASNKDSRSRRSESYSSPQNVTTTPSSNSKPKVSSTKAKKSNKGKSKKIVCICRMPFDDTKFYVGCDLCGNWFHGECVGITEALSRSMTEYVCDDCTNAKISKDLFCFCRQPYDETQFYICCERCEDWFHGKCIGIMQSEADEIDDYICPKCDPNNQWNRPCQKKLNSKEYEDLKKVAKSLIQHKSAWPFLEPVDQSEVPDYYKVVKQPMDLKTIDAKVLKLKYENLSKFVADVMLVFDNCRAYNPPNSSFYSCAQVLELFFCQRLKQLKQKLIQK